MRSSAALLVVAALMLGACSRREREGEQPESALPPGTSAGMPGDGRDVRITTTGNEIDLALIGDTISSGLSQQALARARQETDTATVSGTGVGASIERMVKSGVQTALGTRVAFPISALNDARYENGTIVFDWKQKPTAFVKTRINGKPLLASFQPEDARRFVKAVRTRKQASGL
jgi:hypothetical protein